MKALTIGANSEVLEPGIGRELMSGLDSRGVPIVPTVLMVLMARNFAAMQKYR